MRYATLEYLAQSGVQVHEKSFVLAEELINKSLIIRNNLLKLDVIRDFKAAHKQISNIVEMKEIEVELINRILGSLKDAITKE
ncbi:MAG: hypothetical protein GX815_04680 [Clostridiales bacterium]|nr:hypothetical protein [Clostridiales bacterium]